MLINSKKIYLNKRAREIIKFINKMVKNKIYFLPVHIDYVATIKSIINTCISLKNLKDKYDLTILNAIGEWEEYNKEPIDNNINIKSLFNKTFITRYQKVFS